MKFNKSTLIIIGVILFMSLSITLVISYKLRSLRSTNDELELKLTLKDNEFNSFKDELGFYRGKANTAESDLKTLRNVYEEELRELRKSFTSLDRNFRNLSGVTHASLYTIGEIKTILSDEIKKDTTYTTDGEIKNIRSLRRFTYSDEWSAFDGTVSYNTSKFQDDNLINFNYTIKDSVTFVTSYHKTGTFKPRVLMIEGKSYNPNTRISGLTQVQVREPRRPRYVLGIYGGYGFSKEGLTPNISIGIGRKLLEF